MSDFRVLVTGSREWANPKLIQDSLDVLLAKHGAAGLFVVVHGKNPRGADAIADRWARESFGWVDPEPHPANWRLLGKPAGRVRNQEMVDAGADVCLAFFWAGAANAGTADCAARARAAQIPVIEIYGGPE